MNKLVKLLLRWKLLAVLIVVAGFVIGRLLGRFIPAPIIIALFVFLFLIALFFYFFSDRILLRWYHAKELNDENSPLYKITQRLAKMWASKSRKSLLCIQRCQMRFQLAEMPTQELF